MIDRAERISNAIKLKGLSYAELERITGVSKSALQRYASGETKKIPVDVLESIAAATGVTAKYLMGWEEDSNISAIYQKNIRMVPVFESVSAGFGAYADDQILDYCPFIINSEKEAAETIAIRVSGDSMSPKIEDGDIIRVHKQDSVDSGSIAVVLLDGEEGLVKKVVYGDDWIELHSINPYYPVRRFDGEEVLRLRVVGLVKGCFRDI